MRIIKQSLFLSLIALSLAACNTMEGIGKDIGAAGDKLETSADKNKKY